MSLPSSEPSPNAQPMKLQEENRCFGGVHRRYRHRSRELAGISTFAVFLPSEALQGQPVPVLYWLSGLTCTDQNVMQKSGLQRLAADLGLAVVAPDTSPRGEQVPQDPDGGCDLGHGAGFYVDATQSPWTTHYRMHSYVTAELPALVERELPLLPVRGISGHSMGGHGALVCALRHPGRYRSVSAFAPIAHPSACPWGRKAFGSYLGQDPQAWQEWDGCELLSSGRRITGPGGEALPLLVDQGLADGFLEEQLRLQPGYDHSYFFITSFIDDHLRHHASALRTTPTPWAAPLQ